MNQKKIIIFILFNYIYIIKVYITYLILQLSNFCNYIFILPIIYQHRITSSFYIICINFIRRKTIFRSFTNYCVRAILVFCNREINIIIYVEKLLEQALDCSRHVVDFNIKFSSMLNTLQLFLKNIRLIFFLCKLFQFSNFKIDKPY